MRSPRQPKIVFMQGINLEVYQGSRRQRWITEQNLFEKWIARALLCIDLVLYTRLRSAGGYTPPAKLAGARTETREPDRGPCFGAIGDLRMPRAAGCRKNDAWLFLWSVIHAK